MSEHGREYTSHLQAQGQAQLRDLVNGYPVRETIVEPTLCILMTDHWIEMTLRYVGDVRNRRFPASQKRDWDG